MRLSKVGYYGDFVIYPVAIGGMATIALWRASPEQFAISAMAFVSGIGIWTLVEYFLHRFLLHHMPYFREMHEEHHNSQTALIGSPMWLSLALFVGLVFLPLQLIVPALASGLTAGFMAGYLWYVSVHHLIHHAGLGQSAYADRLRRRHMLHHHFDEKGNFGVTSGFWDRIFRTDIQVGAAGRAPSREPRPRRFSVSPPGSPEKPASHSLPNRKIGNQ